MKVTQKDALIIFMTTEKQYYIINIKISGKKLLVFILWIILYNIGSILFLIIKYSSTA